MQHKDITSYDSIDDILFAALCVLVSRQPNGTITLEAEDLAQAGLSVMAQGDEDGRLILTRVDQEAGDVKH